MKFTTLYLKEAVKIREHGSVAFVTISKDKIEQLLKKTNALEELSDDVDIIFEWED